MPQRKSKCCIGTVECNKNAAVMLKLIKVIQDREDKMEKDISELKMK